MRNHGREGEGNRGAFYYVVVLNTFYSMAKHHHHHHNFQLASNILFHGTTSGGVLLLLVKVPKGFLGVMTSDDTIVKPCQLILLLAMLTEAGRSSPSPSDVFPRFLIFFAISLVDLPPNKMI